MTVENAETPRPHREASRAGKQDAHQVDHEIALLPLVAGCDQVNEQRRREHSKEHEQRYRQAKDGTHRAGNAIRFLLIPLLQQARVNGNERGREHAFPE